MRGTSSEGYVSISTEPELTADDADASRRLIGNRNSLRNSITRSFPHGGTITISQNRSYVYSYGPKGLAGLIHNHYALQCAVFASIGGLTFGYDQGVIANVLVMQNFMEKFPISAWQIGLMTAILELGALLGALLAGYVADRYSRRHSIFVACVIFCVGSAYQCGAQSLNDLFFGRAIGGIGIGALSMISPLYMAEISPPEVRGSLMALEQFSIVLGVVFGFWAGFFTRSINSSASWRIPLGLQIAPGILLGIGSLFLPPSPRLLILHGRKEEALLSLAHLRLRDLSDGQIDPLLQLEYFEMQVEAELLQRTVSVPDKSHFAAYINSYRRLFSKKYLDRTLIGIMVMFFQQWSGINALLYYGPTLIRSLGIRGETVSLLTSGGIGIVQFLAVFPAILFVDRLGRKPLLMGGATTMGLSHLCIAVLIWLYQDSWSNHTYSVWFAVGMVYLFTAAYGLSFGPVAWILPSEVFPLSARSTGVSIATSSNWINNFFIGLVTPRFIDISAAGTFLIFSASCFLASIWARIFVPETANLSLEEIDGLFGSGFGKADMTIRSEISQELGLNELIDELVSTDTD